LPALPRSEAPDEDSRRGAARVFFARACGTLPVRDSVLAPRVVLVADFCGFGVLRGLATGSSVVPVPLRFVAPGVRVGLGVAVGLRVGAAVGATVGAVVAVGVGVVSVEPRSTIEETGAGRPGIWTWPTDEPAGTSTVIVSCWPVTSVTRT